MKIESPTRTVVMSVVPPLTVWAIGKILEIPSVKAKVRRVDSRANKQTYGLERSLRRGVKNAKSNAAWLAAGAAAIVIGVGLIANAARHK